MSVDHAEQVHAALVDPAVEVVLGTGQRLLDQQPHCAACRRQATGDDALERRQHALPRPALQRAEAHQALEGGALVYAPRQYREGAARRLHMARIAQGVGDAAHLQRVDYAETDIRVRTGLLEQLPHVQLVLAGEDGLGRGAGQAAALGHQRGRQRTLEFMV